MMHSLLEFAFFCLYASICNGDMQTNTLPRTSLRIKSPTDYDYSESEAANPYYCDETDLVCYKLGKPVCCLIPYDACPTDEQPDCDNDTSGSEADPSCSSDYDCASGSFCSNGRCESSSRRSVVPAVVPAGGVCRLGIDACTTGYECIQNLCTVPYIPADPYCSSDYECASGSFCSNGRCESSSRSVVPAVVPEGGSCQLGINVCTTGYACTNYICSATKWFASNGRCVMDCPSTDAPCCGGLAGFGQEDYTTVDTCCDGEYPGDITCVSYSMQCSGEEQLNKLPRTSLRIKRG